MDEEEGTEEERISRRMRRAFIGVVVLMAAGLCTTLTGVHLALQEVSRTVSDAVMYAGTALCVVAFACMVWGAALSILHPDLPEEGG